MRPRHPYLYLFLFPMIAAGLEEKTPKSFHGMSLQYCTETDGSEGMNSSKVQPSDQMELFQSFSVNRTHFELRWKSNPQVCGKNVTSYDVDVTSDSVIINAILGWFGAFPQSMCAKGSKSNNKVRTQEGVVPNSCSPYPERCDEEARVSTIALPVQVWPLVRWSNLQFRIRSWGTVAKRDCSTKSFIRGGAGAVKSGDNEQAEDDENCPFSTTESTPVVFHCVVFKRALNEDELIESS